MSAQALDRVLANPRVLEKLHVATKIDRDHDLPYLAGYSGCGKTLYVDRHLPEELELEEDGQRQMFHPHEFVLLHERLEKALINALGWGYWPAHSAANGWERRHVLERLGPGSWPAYEKVLMSYVKAGEREKLVKVPADLDMTPYYAPPVDRALVARMQEAQGKKHKYTKTEVAYSDQGKPAQHCGPVSAWPRGACEHFVGPHGCELVRGYVEPKGWCNKWKAKRD